MDCETFTRAPRLDFFLKDVVDVDADPHVVGRERGAGIEAVADGRADGVVRIELSRHTEPVELAAHDCVRVGVDDGQKLASEALMPRPDDARWIAVMDSGQKNWPTRLRFRQRRLSPTIRQKTLRKPVFS